MYAKNTWEKYKDQLNEVFDYNEGYKHYISKNKTERACVKDSIKLAEEKGFKPLESFDTLKSGDKVYVTNREKNIALFIIGKKPLTEGMRILGAHIDSPRMDLKQNPLYESEGFTLADTHYYGGIKKYQWVTIPLSLYGVVCKKDGTVVDAGGYEIYAIVPGLDCKISIYPTQVTEEGEYLEDLNNPWYMGQENEVIILRCNMSEIFSNVMVSVQKQNMSVQYHPMVSLKDGHLAAEAYCYDFSIYYDWDEYQSEYDYSLDINIARDLIAQTDEVSYYLGLGMSLWYTGTEEYIEGRNCPVFVIGTDHEEHFTKEKYYAAGDNVVYYYDPLGDAWLLLGAG